MSYPKVLLADLQPAAHIQEMRHTLAIQQNVNGNEATACGVHQILQDVGVRYHVHHYRYHLREKQFNSFILKGTTIYDELLVIFSLFSSVLQTKQPVMKGVAVSFYSTWLSFYFYFNWMSDTCGLIAVDSDHLMCRVWRLAPN